MAINVSDSSITTNKIADGAVTWNKMGTEYVPYLRVNGAKITTGHNSINFTGRGGMMVDYDSSSMSLIFHPDTTLLAGTSGKGGMNPLSVNYNDVEFVNTITGPYDPGPTTSTKFVLHGNLGTTGSTPTWGLVNLSTDVSGLLDLGTYADGVLPLAYGGTNNIPAWSALEGVANSAGNNSSVVAGGAANNADNVVATIGGGFNNNCFGDDGVVAGGETNQVGAEDDDPGSFHSAIGGGALNTVIGIGTAIPGGLGLYPWTILI